MGSNFTPSTCPGVFKWTVCIPQESCIYFMKIPRKYQCAFVRETADCKETLAYIQYMEVFACEYNDYDGQIYFGVGIVLTEIILLFLVLSATADCFFGPTLCAMSNIMGLSEHLAGVTLLAFGNSAPDIVTSIVGATFLGPELVLCQLLGGGIFVISVVAASIVVTKQFRADSVSFIRDTFCYLLAISFLFYSAENDVIELWESVTLIVMYCVYVGLVFIEAFRKRRAEKKYAKPIVRSETSNEDTITVKSERRYVRTGDGVLIDITPASAYQEDPSGQISATSSTPGTVASQMPSKLGSTSHVPPATVPRRRGGATRASFLDGIINAQRMNALNSAGMQEQVSQERMGHIVSTAVLRGSEILYEKPKTVILDFVNEMNPLDEDDWESSKFLGRTLMLLQAPIVYLFKLIIPVVDQGALNNGWCKLLNSFHCVVTPLFSAYAFQITDLPSSVYVPVFGALLAVGTGLGIFVFVTSSVDRAPRYHVVFAVMGFLVSMQMIYTIAHELVYVIGVLGYILVIDLPTLAMTVLAWGNSVGDLVANTALARAGYPRMAWAGCFGSPLMSVLLGAGISFTLLVELRGEDHRLGFEPRYKGIICDCFFFLFLSLMSSLIIKPAVSFQCRRSYGCYLIVLYLMFMIFITLTGFEVIHPIRST